MAPAAVPGDVAVERQLLGALLVTDLLERVLGETTIRPKMFVYEQSHGEVFAAMIAMHDAGRSFDPNSLTAELRERGTLEQAGGRDYLHRLAAEVEAPGNAVEYAKVIVREAEWRLRLEAHHRLGEAIAERDKDKVLQAEAMLARDLQHVDADFEPEQLRDIAFQLLEGNAAEAFPLPFERLNDLLGGGIRRGNLMVIGGHTSHGKSVLADEILEHVAKHKPGAKLRLYINEMAPEERVARTLNRATGAPYAGIMAGDFSPYRRAESYHASANRALQDNHYNRTFPFGITNAAGWSVQEIAHHIRRKRWDICVVDILHLIEHREERDLAEISSTLNRTAKLADCAIIATVHLNEKRVSEIVRPMPTIGDIRGSGSIKNDADVVCFVYRDQDAKTGDPQSTGLIYISKARGGKTGGMPAEFEDDFLRFVPARRDDEPPLEEWAA